MLPIPEVKSGKVPLPGEEKPPQAQAPYGESPWGSQQWFSTRVGFTSHQLLGNDSYLWLSQPKGVSTQPRGLVQGCIKHLQKRAPKAKKFSNHKCQ